MKILQLCNKSPWPPKEGGSIAMTSVRQGLALQGHYVHSLVVNTPKMPLNTADISKDYLVDGPVESVFIDTRPKALPAFKDLMKKTSYQISRFYHPAFEAKLRELLKKEKWDLVILESVYMMPYFEIIRSTFSKPIVLRAHNVEHIVWKRILKNTRNPLKKRYLAVLQSQLKKYELDAIKKVSAVACISDIDTEYFQKTSPDANVFTFPFALDEKELEPKEKEFDFHFGHIGSMDWAPNLEGLRHFVLKMWPVILKAIPFAEFHLAGRHFPQNFPKYSGVIIHGEVEDATEFMQSLDAMIVPLLSGSGVRIKIVEAMQNGVPVISTPVGAEGLDLVNGEHAYICETAAEYIKAMNLLKENSERIRRNALERVKTRHSLKYATEILLSQLEKL
ncbi:MAG: glycosyltransferase [Bacteroidales bacterium]|nr:glycosyltransferase [Bacteroidales bacterium]